MVTLCWPISKRHKRDLCVSFCFDSEEEGLAIGGVFCLVILRILFCPVPYAMSVNSSRSILKRYVVASCGSASERGGERDMHFLVYSDQCQQQRELFLGRFGKRRAQQSMWCEDEEAMFGLVTQIFVCFHGWADW